MLCDKCGAELLPGAKFCNECGAKVENNVSSAPIAEETIVAEEVITDNAGDEILSAAETAADDFDPQTEVIDKYSDNVIGQAEPLTDDTNYKSLDEVVKSEYIGYDPQKQTVNNYNYFNAKKAPYKRSGGAHAGAVIVSIILFVILTATIALSAVQLTLNENTVSDALKRANIADLKVEDIFDEKTLSDLGLESTADGTKLIDFVYDNIDQDQLAQPISREDFYTIANSDEFRDFVAMMISRKASNIIEGVRSNLFDIDEIIDFLVEKRDFLENVVGYKITDEMIQKLRDTFTEKYSEVLSDIQTDEVSDKLGPAVSAAIKIIFAKWLLIVMIAVSCLLMILIFLITHSWRFGLLYNGIVLAIVSAMYIAAALVFNFANLTFGFDNTNSALLKTAFRAAGAICNVLLLLNGIIFAVALVMIIVSVIIYSVQRKKYAGQA